MTLTDESYWFNQYGDLGQVILDPRFWNNGTPVSGQQFEYKFDDIGNRRWTKTGGNEQGLGLRQSSYSPNLLNQYSSREVFGVVDVMGLSGGAVTVNSSPADYRRGEYFYEALTVANTSNPVWQGLNVNAGGTATTGNILVPPATQAMSFDADGNLLSDG